MKKKLLFASFIFTSIAHSQNLTQANEPIVGASATMYVCDSAYTNYNATTGTGVTWDFSGLTGYSAVPAKILTVADATGSSYIGATKVTSIPGFVSTYWASTPTDRTSYGFVFTDVTVGDVDVNFDIDAEKIMNYPFAVTNTFTDPYSGTLTNGSIAPTGTPCSGSVVSIVDGQGTLLLPDGTSRSSVLRHKIVETTLATISVGPFTTDVTVIRTQFDYYDILNSSMPVFTQTTIEVQGTTINSSVTLVLSSVQPTALVSLGENTKNDFVVYPNPTQGNVTIKGTFAADATVSIVDQVGRVVSSLENVSNGTSIDLNQVASGMYSVVILNNGIKTTKTVRVN